MQRKKEVWIVVACIAVVVIGAIALALFGSGTPTKQAFLNNTVPALATTDWQRGKQGAAVSVIEYGDFQCPACGAYEPMVEALTKEYGDRVAFSFRNYPLPQHQDAQIAAQAAEAAGVQGKYWEMHDLLYAKQTLWSNEGADTVVAKFFDGYAKSLGLDVAKFDADIKSDAVIRKVQQDQATGNAASIDHTPTFFINLREIQNPNSLDEFKKAIDTVLAPKDNKLPTGQASSSASQ